MKVKDECLQRRKRPENDIGDEGTGTLSEALRANSTLTYLNLRGDEGVKNLAIG